MLLTNSFSKTFYTDSVLCNLKNPLSVFRNGSERLQLGGYMMFLNCSNFHYFSVCLQFEIWKFVKDYTVYNF